jgi:hypothetical protein
VLNPANQRDCCKRLCEAGKAKRKLQDRHEAADIAKTLSEFFLCVYKRRYPQMEAADIVLKQDKVEKSGWRELPRR